METYISEGFIDGFSLEVDELNGYKNWILALFDTKYDLLGLNPEKFHFDKAVIDGILFIEKSNNPDELDTALENVIFDTNLYTSIRNKFTELQIIDRLTGKGVGPNEIASAKIDATAVVVDKTRKSYKLTWETIKRNNKTGEIISNSAINETYVYFTHNILIYTTDTIYNNKREHHGYRISKPTTFTPASASDVYKFIKANLKEN